MVELLSSINVSSQGMSLQRQKMDVAAENMANAETASTTKGGPYQRKRVMVQSNSGKPGFGSIFNAAIGAGRQKGPQISAKVIEDAGSNFRLVHDPNHPYADDDGYVKMPDVEIVNEMVDMMSASRAYEANTVAISVAKQMVKDALDI